MDFTVEKYPEVVDAMGNITSTLVLIRSGRFLCIPASFEGNLMTCTDIELTKLVLDDFYNRMYPNRAEKEAITKLDEAIQKAVTDIQREFETIRADSKKQIDIAVADMTVLITEIFNSHVEEGGEEPPEETEEGVAENEEPIE
ncbi:DUF1366 domain-containing protein [Aerococcaceae bacterium NML160702]|nr:DUF1366 domain-containing protein [Aerococcaceae bacterium NML160702]